MNGTHVIEMQGVTRFYGVQRGVKDLNLIVPEGTILGLLGENGCGKTTAMKLAMGMLLPNQGTVRTLGMDPVKELPPEARARIGWLSDALAVPNRFLLSDAMDLQAAYFPGWDWKLAHELAHRFALGESDIFGRLSLGQKRRFMLTLIIAQKPDLLVLDEPAGGLDPSVRRQLIEILIEQAATRRITIVLSSHILSDVERLVENVAFMKDGRVVKMGELEALRGGVKRLCFSSTAQAAMVREKFRIMKEDVTPDGDWLAVVDGFAPDKMNGLEAAVEHLNLEELFLIYNGATAAREALA